MSKGLETLNKIIDMASEPNGYLNFQNAVDTPYYQIVEKELKALQIIKEKACIDMLDKSNGIEQYGLYILGTKLTKEEYDLLKEVLKDE